ncbi:MAG TPA: type II toxin-antitoxin system RelB/DinJ family antitoxin [Ignavibacteriaceae bacterium]|jgi:DNA-damage-inducible protein J|nr:type II toxin-antitoxin system RelB/DinJ family antitoxin [Ignavibacteriaceae bacterium]
MNSEANIQTRIDGRIKNKAGKILANLGLNHSQAINIFYRQIILRNGIPFSLELPNKTTLDAVAELESKKSIKSYKNSKELFEELDK